MIKAITFDLDGVYFPDGKKKFINNLVALGVSEDEVRRVFLNSPEMNEQYKLGKMTDNEYWTWASSEWSVAGDANELMKLLADSYSVDAEVASFVKYVRSHGIKTLVCSNNFPARVNGLQEKFGFLDDFDAAVFSYQVGFVKPSRQIFEELIRQSQVEASEIVYSDDDKTKLTGAIELGISAFVFEDFEQFKSKLVELGVEL